jgi:hypothetical protein
MKKGTNDTVRTVITDGASAPAVSKSHREEDGPERTPLRSTAESTSVDARVTSMDPGGASRVKSLSDLIRTRLN